MKYTMRKHYIVPLEKGKRRSRCRKWQLRVDSGRKTKSGSTSWLTRTVSGVAEGQAADECAQWAADLDSGAAVGRTSWTFGAYADHYIAGQRAAGYPDKVTVDKKERHLRAACIHLGPIRLQDVSPADIEGCIAALRRGESPSGRQLSSTTVRCVYKTLSCMFRHAVETGELAGNPCSKVTCPRSDTPEKSALRIEAVDALVRQMDPADWHQLGVIMMAETGMRQCAARLCTWDGWDEAAGLLLVPPTKREDRSRLVPVSRTLAEALAVARLHQQLEFGQDAPPWILANRMGRQPGPQALGQWWRENRASYGLEGFGLHQLRHSLTTNLARQRVPPKVIQRIIGDKSLAVVNEVYTHVDTEQMELAMAGLDAARGLS